MRRQCGVLVGVRLFDFRRTMNLAGELWPRDEQLPGERPTEVSDSECRATIK